MPPHAYLFSAADLQTPRALCEGGVDAHPGVAERIGLPKVNLRYMGETANKANKDSFLSFFINMELQLLLVMQLQLLLLLLRLKILLLL